jgi:hypothetical protein
MPVAKSLKIPSSFSILSQNLVEDESYFHYKLDKTI